MLDLRDFYECLANDFLGPKVIDTSVIFLTGFDPVDVVRADYHKRIATIEGLLDAYSTLENCISVDQSLSFPRETIEEFDNTVGILRRERKEMYRRITSIQRRVNKRFKVYSNGNVLLKRYDIGNEIKYFDSLLNRLSSVKDLFSRRKTEDLEDCCKVREEIKRLSILINSLIYKGPKLRDKGIAIFSKASVLAEQNMVYIVTMDSGYHLALNDLKKRDFYVPQNLRVLFLNQKNELSEF